LLLNMLPNSAEHRGRDGAYDFTRVLATDSGHVAYSLCHGIVMIAEDLGKRGWPLRIFGLRGGFTMNRRRPAAVRVRGDCRSYQRNRSVHGPLRNDRIDAKALTHLLNGRIAHLLLNLFLNRVENGRH
jgi:hypothetical protein